MNGDVNQEARKWGMWCHLSAIVAWIPQLLLAMVGIPLPVPFLSILLPLIIWSRNKEKHPFIDAQGKESLNFQISILIYSIIGGIIAVFLVFTTCGFMLNSSVNEQIVNFLIVVTIAMISLLVVIVISQLILIIFASVKAYKGQSYRYPFTIRFLR